MMGRFMAVDPGEKRIGLAISDETGTLARGLTVLNHVSLKTDCLDIFKLVQENQIIKIIVGSPVSETGEERPQTRHAQKIADTLGELSGLPVELWDENGSTQRARQIRIETGVKQQKRGGHLDEVAAAVILQSWLDSHLREGNDHE